MKKKKSMGILGLVILMTFVVAFFYTFEGNVEAEGEIASDNVYESIPEDIKRAQAGIEAIVPFLEEKGIDNARDYVSTNLVDVMFGKDDFIKFTFKNEDFVTVDYYSAEIMDSNL